MCWQRYCPYLCSIRSGFPAQSERAGMRFRTCQNNQPWTVYEFQSWKFESTGTALTEHLVQSKSCILKWHSFLDSFSKWTEYCTEYKVFRFRASPTSSKLEAHCQDAVSSADCSKVRIWRRTPTWECLLTLADPSCKCISVNTRQTKFWQGSQRLSEQLSLPTCRSRNSVTVARPVRMSRAPRIYFYKWSEAIWW